LQSLHKSASRLESEYMKSWLPSLTKTHADLEEKTNIRTGVDTSEVVLKYRSLQQRQDDVLAERPAARGRGKARARGVRGRVGRGSESNAGRKLKSIVNGIPEGAAALDYIQYRKCLYIETIKEWRESLCSILNPPVLNDLLLLLSQLSRHNANKNEIGLLTLEAILTSPYTTHFLLAPHSFHHNFQRGRGTEVGRGGDRTGNLDTRIGTTILHYCLAEGHRLTHLSLEKACCDSLLALIGRVAHNLRYLNICGSVVTDQGLLDLCGVEPSSGERQGARPRLARACKASESVVSGPVRNLVPRWVKSPGRGAVKLQQVEATNLHSLQWNLDKSFQYTDYSTVPLDAGFVALLTFMPQLKILNTEVSGRAVVAYVKGRQKLRRKVKPLALEILVEAHPSPALLECVVAACPRLQEVRVDWFQVLHPHNTSREDWVTHIAQVKQLTRLHSTDIDYKTDKLLSALPAVGPRLVVLHLQELWSLRYSLVRAVKQHCPVLEQLAVLMTSKDVVGAIAQISVDKDVNIAPGGGQESATTHRMDKLEQVHLVGPYGCDFVRYTLSGCPNVKSLTLGVEWPDPAFCNVQPGSRKDLLGKEYLEEVRTNNRLDGLEELHLLAQYGRGRTKLNKELADYVLSEFKKLKHLGTFRFWNLTQQEISVIRHGNRKINRDITTDEDFTARQSQGKNKFLYNYTSGRGEAACSWLPLRSPQFAFIDEVAEILAGPPIPWDDNDSDSDSSVDEDFLDDSSDDEDDDMQIPFDPFCVIQ